MKKEIVRSVALYSILAAVAFIVPAIIFIKDANFTDTWVLYLGNVLFGVAVSLFMLRHIQFRHEGGSTVSMAIMGHLVTAAGIILSCIFAFIALSIFIPGIFGSGKAETVLQQAPTQARGGKTDGMVLMIFMNAVIGNVAAGSFFSLIFAYAAKINQTRDKESTFLKE